MRRLRDKSDALDYHARKRALERYGIELTDKLKDQIIRRIRSGDFEFTEQQSLRVKHYVMKIEEQLVRVLYDKSRRALITFLPKETVNQRLISEDV